MRDPEAVKVLRWIDAEERRFLGVLGESLAQGAVQAGAHLVCRAGCTDCCMGSFPITPLDARRLHRGFGLLRQREPDRAAAVLERARTRVEEHDSEGPCPALDPETGACDLYEWRPVTCRTYGPPIQIGEDRLPPCGLCFTSASEHEIEAARVTIDPDGDEEALLQALSVVDPGVEDTTVAEALIAAGLGAR